MSFLALAAPLAGTIAKTIDGLFTSDEERLEAKRKIEKLAMEGAFQTQQFELEQGRQELERQRIQMSAIIAEAKSEDRWTSRMRPAFLGVMYLIILSAFPFAIAGVFFPERAAAGLELWRGALEAIPSDMMALFGAGYLGYAGARTFDKREKGQTIKQAADKLDRLVAADDIRSKGGV